MKCGAFIDLSENMFNACSYFVVFLLHMKSTLKTISAI